MRHTVLSNAEGRRALAGDRSVLDGPKPAKATATPEGATAAMLREQMAAARIPHRCEVPVGALVGRKWRVDFVLEPALIAGAMRPVVVEVDGAVHRTRERFEGDREKARALACLGYVLIPFTAFEVRSGAAIRWLGVIYGGASA